MPGFWAGEDLTPNDIELARRRAMRRPGYVDLASTNPTYHGLLFPAAILDEAAGRYWGARRYDPDPRGLPAARAAIAAYYRERTPPLDLPEENIYITASTSEAYSLLFALLAEPGDNLLAPAVTYPLFEFLAAIHHIELRPYRMVEHQAWAIDEPSLIEAMDERTRGLLIVSPHNPTGKVIGEPINTVDRLGLPVICDEVFAPIAYRTRSVPPLGTLHPQLPVFHLNGISKMFALPDMKLGWAALNNPAQSIFGERLELLNDTFLGANGLSQHMLPVLFEQGRPFIRAMVSRMAGNLDFALARFQASARVHAQPPDGGYYLFPAIDIPLDEETLVLRLLEAGINVHPGYFYGCEQGVHLMLSALVEPPIFRAGVERLLASLDHL
jgi:aspartate/methionine/tyrosine aminotransferase